LWDDQPNYFSKAYLIEYTDPDELSDVDTDGDGVNDYREGKDGTNPNNAYSFDPRSKGMVAYYRFNENFNDESGFQNDLSNMTSGVQISGDRFGNMVGSVKLTSNEDYAFSVKKSGISGNQNHSISLWVYFAEVPVWDGRYEGSLVRLGSEVGVVEGSEIGRESRIMVDNSNEPGQSRLLAHGGYSDLEKKGLGDIFHGQWRHIVFSYNGEISTSSLHLDGVKLDASLWMGLNNIRNIVDGPVYLGSTPLVDGRASGSVCQLSDIRIYNRAISAEEVASLYAAESTPKSSFQIIEGSYTWQQAKADAEARGGRLAVLNTQAKIDEANAFLQNQGSWPLLWIGLTDEVTEGQWKWVNGDLLSASNWYPGEPNNQGNEDYALLYLTGTWIDAGGGFSYLFEFPKQTLTVFTPVNGTITGSGEYDPGATATITATPNPGYIFTGWTGAASGTTNPLTITMDADKSVGATFAADLSDADADGVTAYDEVTLYQTNPTQADSDGDGLTDGYEIGIGRFSVVSGSRTWAQAKAHAETQGGTLATFANEDEWNLAMQSIGTDALLDIGGLWIGATDEAVEGTWRWVTGEPFVFTRWETGQPDNLNNSDYAAVAGDLGGTSGKWYDYRAITTRDGYILESGYSTNPSDADSDDDGLLDGAEMTAGTNPFVADTDGDGLTDTQEVNLTHTNPKLADSNSNGINDALDDQDSDGLSDSEELSHPGRYFTLIEGSFTHAQAAADAANRRGRLASFPNANDFTRAAAKARKTNQGYLWFGLSDAATEGTWLWSDGSAPTYARWLNGQPDGSNTENHAVLMQNGSQWADAAADFVAVGYLFERVGLDPLDADTDDDGLSDGAEINTHQTNPVLDDSDSDGLADGAEINTHGSNPKLADTDGDGLGDSAEVVTHGTNPAVKDSDTDGFDDLFEINTGFDPKQSSSTPDAVSSIRTAVEFRFNAGNGLNYRIESSTDLETWTTVESDIIGTGGVVTRFYSTENQPKRFFRVVKNLNN
jgi:uncharacterized repeat protein (TIGR02543 family)